MTWAEFKQAVEAQGVEDSDEINYIDISFPSHIEVTRNHHTLPNSFEVTDI
jgi:hypothetical protein